MATDTPESTDAPTESAESHPSSRGIRRRDVVFGGGGIAFGVAAAFGGMGIAKAVTTPNGTAAASGPGYATARYASTMLTAPKLSVWSRAGATFSTDRLFVTPHTDQFSPVVYDSTGEPVWIDPSGSTGTDFRVQQYRGEPVLTYWSGRVSAAGTGAGHGVLLDSAYRPVASVYAANGLQNDLHEFELTDAGTALITSYPPAPADLTALGGPAKGYIYDCHIQEIDVATGELLMSWRASRHIALAESYEPLDGTGVSPETPYDPFHLNAVSADSADTLLLSARHTHTVYSLDRATGDIRWRLGGKQSDFTVAADAQFAWQHHARRLSSTQLTLFDNHTLDYRKGPSRGLLLTVDENAKTATLAQAYTYQDHTGTAMGSVQPLSNGNVLVGWGIAPYATEFTAAGTAVWQVGDLGSYTYRAQKSTWVGRPRTVPDVAVTKHPSGTNRVSVSWNGATEVASWRVLTGGSADELAPVATAQRSGFETTIDVGQAAHLRVDALDATGTVLASSPVVRA